MKKVLITISIALFLFACNKNDDDSNNVQEEKTIIGNWKLVEIFGHEGINDVTWGSEVLEGEAGDGGDPRWYTADNGYIYTFKNNGNFTTNRVFCTGNYTLENESLVQINGCEEPEINILLFYTLENDNNVLILSPEPNFCIDSCIAKFIKVDEGLD